MLARFIGGPAHDETADIPMRRVRLEGGHHTDTDQRHVLVAVVDGDLLQYPAHGIDVKRVMNAAAGHWASYTPRGGPQPRGGGLLRLYYRPPTAPAPCLDVAAAIRRHFTSAPT